MKVIFCLLACLAFATTTYAQSLIVAPADTRPKFVGKQGKVKVYFESIKLGFTKSAEEEGDGSLKTLYVIFHLSPNHGEKYPPQNPDYLSRIYKLTNIPAGYDPKGYSGEVVRKVSKDFLAYVATTYGVVPEHYSAAFETSYQYKTLAESLKSSLDYNRTTSAPRTYVIDDNFSFDFSSTGYGRTYEASYAPPKTN